MTTKKFNFKVIYAIIACIFFIYFIGYALGGAYFNINK